jgi:WD40 repeat protein
VNLARRIVKRIDLRWWLVVEAVMVMSAKAAPPPTGAASSPRQSLDEEVYRKLDQALSARNESEKWNSLNQLANSNPELGDFWIALGLAELQRGNTEVGHREVERGLDILERELHTRAVLHRAQAAYFSNVAFTPDGLTLVLSTSDDLRLVSATDFSLKRVMTRVENSSVLVQQGQRLTLLQSAKEGTNAAWSLPNGWFLRLSPWVRKTQDKDSDEPMGGPMKCSGAIDLEKPHQVRTCTAQGPRYRLVRELRPNYNGGISEYTSWFEPPSGSRQNLRQTPVSLCGSAPWFLVKSDQIEIHDAGTGRILAKLEQSSQLDETVVCSPDGKRIAAQRRLAAFVWSAPDGKLLTQILPQSSEPTALNDSKFGILVPNVEHVVGHEKVVSLGFLPGPRLLTVGASRTILNWDLVNGVTRKVGSVPVAVFSEVLRNGTILAVQPNEFLLIDGTTGATKERVPVDVLVRGGSQGGPLTLVNGGALWLRSERHRNPLTTRWPVANIAQAAASSDGRLVALGETSGSVLLCRPDRTGCVARLPRASEHPQPIEALVFDADANRLAVAVNLSVVVWDLSQRKRTHRFDGCGPGPLAFVNGGKSLLTWGCLIELDSGAIVRLEQPAEGRVLAFSHDGRFAARADRNGELELWDPVKLNTIVRLEASDRGESAYIVTPEGQLEWLLEPNGSNSGFYCSIGPVALPLEACRSRLQTRGRLRQLLSATIAQ